MLISNWPNAIAHVDADCFYASCEQLRRPDLKGKSICVLSSQDACVIAKTYDAKAAGIATGMPVWEAKRKLPDAIFLPADFCYYSQMSDKLFAILRRYSPVVEKYSIYKIEAEARLPKSVDRTASMGEVTQDRQTIHAHLLNHAMRLSKELITKQLTARQLTVFLTLKSFDKQAATSEFPYQSADYFLLASEAGRVLDALYNPECHYRACGLIASDIAIRQLGSFDLFQMAEQQREEKHLKLLETLHAINHKHGGNVLSICGAIQKRRAGGEMERFEYPVLECS